MHVERVEPGLPANVKATPAPDEGHHWFDLAASSRESTTKSATLIRRELEGGQVCHSWKGGRYRLFGIGSEQADLLIVNEARASGSGDTIEPFVGPAGEMLEKMLVHVLGLAGAQVYVANIVRLQPNQNREIRSDEVIECSAALEEILSLIKPKIVLALGTQPLQAIFDPRMNILKCRGAWREWRGVPVMATYHPSYLLRNSSEKRLTFQDLKSVRARYDAEGGKRD